MLTEPTICKRALFFTHSRHLIREGCNHFPIKKYHLSAFRSLRKWILLCRFSGFLITEVFPYMILWTARALSLTTDVQLRIATFCTDAINHRLGGLLLWIFFTNFVSFKTSTWTNTRPQVLHLSLDRHHVNTHYRRLNTCVYVCLHKLSNKYCKNKTHWKSPVYYLFLIFWFHMIQI